MIRFAATAMALAIMLGAFAAHVLKTQLDAYGLEIIQKAVFYQVINSLGIFVIFILGHLKIVKAAKASDAALFLAFGIVVFSGSLLLLAATGIKTFGAITPIGGVALIIGWLMLVF